MVDPDDVLRSLLVSATAVTALVGDRIYADIMPTTVRYPLVVYTQPNVSPERTLRGGAGADHLTYQVDIWALLPESGRQVGRAVRDALDGQRSAQWFVALSRQQISFDDGYGLYHVMQEYAMSAESVATE